MIIICLLAYNIYVSSTKPSHVEFEIINPSDDNQQQNSQEDVKKLYIDFNNIDIIIKKGSEFNIDHNFDLEIKQNLDEIVLKNDREFESTRLLIITLDEKKFRYFTY